MVHTYPYLLRICLIVSSLVNSLMAPLPLPMTSCNFCLLHPSTSLPFIPTDGLRSCLSLVPPRLSGPLPHRRMYYGLRTRSTGPMEMSHSHSPSGNLPSYRTSLYLVNSCPLNVGSSTGALNTSLPEVKSKASDFVCDVFTHLRT